MKTNWIKRGLTLLCCGMLMAGMTGCGDKGGSSSSTPGSKTESSTPTSQSGSASSGKLLDEPLEIEFLLGGNDNFDPDGIMMKEIEEKTNVHLKINAIPSDYGTKRNTMLASNDIPDAVWCELTNIKQYGPLGMFLNLSDYEEDMPNYMALINADDRKDATKVLYLDGNLYTFARLERYRRHPHRPPGEEQPSHAHHLRGAL